MKNVIVAILLALLPVLASAGPTESYAGGSCDFVDPNYCKLLKHYLKLNSDRQQAVKGLIAANEVNIAKYGKIKSPSAPQTIATLEARIRELKAELAELKSEAGDMHSQVMYLEGSWPEAKVDRLTIKKDITKETLDQEIRKADPQNPRFNVTNVAPK